MEWRTVSIELTGTAELNQRTAFILFVRAELVQCASRREYIELTVPKIWYKPTSRSADREGQPTRKETHLFDNLSAGRSLLQCSLYLQVR